jgi:hypothetical protein
VNGQLARILRMMAAAHVAVRFALWERWNAAGRRSATSPAPRPVPKSPRQWRSRCARIAAVRH